MSARLPNIGVAVRMREAGPGDKEALRRMLAAMDRYGLYQRHFAHGEAPNLALLERLADADGVKQVVMVAETADGELVAHGEFVADTGDGRGAEFALMVLPHWRGMGIAGGMLRELLARAAAGGHAELRGLIQGGNTAMLRLAHGLGFERRNSDDPAVVLVSRPLSPSDDAWPPPPINW